MLQRSHPVPASLDIANSVELHEQRPGFRATFNDDGYRIVVRDRIAIHLWRCEDRIHHENTSCCVEVDGVDDLYRETQVAGVVHPNGPLRDQPRGMREFAVLDLYGNRNRFGPSTESRGGPPP